MFEKRVGNKAKLLRFKREIIVSTMNVRTIREEHKQLELKYNFESHGLIMHDLYILRIQEHRTMHDETVNYNTLGHSTLITTSTWTIDQGASIGGIMLNKRLINSLCEVISHSERILISKFHGIPAISIIIIYSPTNSSEDEFINKFYYELRRAIETIPHHNILIIIGDFNVRIGKYDGNFTYHQETNKNGLLLIDNINENN